MFVHRIAVTSAKHSEPDVYCRCGETVKARPHDDVLGARSAVDIAHIPNITML